MYYFSLVCIIRKASKNVEVKVDVQKGALGFRVKLAVDVLISSNPSFHPLLSCGNSPQ